MVSREVYALSRFPCHRKGTSVAWYDVIIPPRRFFIEYCACTMDIREQLLLAQSGHMHSSKLAFEFRSGVESRGWSKATV